MFRMQYSESVGVGTPADSSNFFFSTLQRPTLYIQQFLQVKLLSRFFLIVIVRIYVHQVWSISFFFRSFQRMFDLKYLSYNCWFRKAFVEVKAHQFSKSTFVLDQFQFKGEHIHLTLIWMGAERILFRPLGWQSNNRRAIKQYHHQFASSNHKVQDAQKPIQFRVALV